jgi:hypothetical protein
MSSLSNGIVAFATKHNVVAGALVGAPLALAGGLVAGHALGPSARGAAPKDHFRQLVVRQWIGSIAGGAVGLTAAVGTALALRKAGNLHLLGEAARLKPFVLDTVSVGGTMAALGALAITYGPDNDAWHNWPVPTK